MTQKELDKLNEGRLLRAGSPLLLPMLQSRAKTKVSEILVKYKTGDHNYTHLVAELSILKELEAEILRKHTELETLEEKHYGKEGIS